MKSSWFWVAAVCVVLGACGDDDDSGPSTTGGGGGSSSTGPASNCTSRCSAVATQCGQPSSACATQCQSLTEAQLSCIEKANCQIEDFQTCLSGSGAGGNGQAGTSSTGGTGGTGTAGTGTAGTGTAGTGTAGTGTAGTGTAGTGTAGTGQSGSAGSASNICDSVGKKCVYDDFFSSSCAKKDADRPYFLVCTCDPGGEAKYDCVPDGSGEEGGYCCAKKP